MAITEIAPATDDRNAEPGLTLEDPPPRTLGTLDQIALWGNLGVSLLGPAYAIYVLEPVGLPALSLAAAFTAVVVGTLIGTLLLSAAAVPGAQTGQPAMVLLRGLFGGRLSYLPTVLNLLQCLGWAVFELVVISNAAEALLPWEVHWPYVILAGALTTLLTLRPLGMIRVLRKYALIAVLASTVYFMIQLLRGSLPGLNDGSWSGFWIGADVLIAISVSWAPLAADFSRHSRSPRAAFIGSYIGFTVSQIAYYTLGLLAFTTLTIVDQADHAPVFNALIAVPLGWLPFAVLVLRELDESFTNVYSTAVSVQNLGPRLDRRVLAVVIGTTATVFALWLGIGDYQNFLLLIGSVFVPLFAVFIVEYFVLSGRTRWNSDVDAPTRWMMLIPWLLGFCAYQLVNPGSVSWWVDAWTDVQSWLNFTPQTWMSASIISFAVSALATLLVGAVGRVGTLREVGESGEVRQ